VQKEERMIEVTIKEIRNRRLDKCYISMYILRYPVPMKREELTEDIDLYVIYGVNLQGKRRIIDIAFNRPKDNRFWLEKFEYIKSKGVEEILFLVTNIDKNIDKAIRILYSNTTIVASATDIINQFNKYLTSKRSTDIGARLKKLFLAEDIKTYEVELELVKEDMKNYKIVLILLDRYVGLIKDYYKYCKDIRKLIFPYFTIRDFQCEIRRIGNSVKFFNNIDEVIAELLKYINRFENGSSYNGKKAWLQ